MPHFTNPPPCEKFIYRNPNTGFFENFSALLYIEVLMQLTSQLHHVLMHILLLPVPPSLLPDAFKSNITTHSMTSTTNCVYRLLCFYYSADR